MVLARDNSDEVEVLILEDATVGDAFVADWRVRLVFTMSGDKIKAVDVEHKSP